MNRKRNEIDMLHGPLTGKLLLFTLPIALSSMVQQLFNAADTAVVGYFGSEGALAAVGTNTEIIALVVTLSSDLSIGANILIADHVGRNETKELPAAVQTAMLSGIVNVGLNLVFVVVLRMGVAGGAVATGLTTTLSMLYHAFPWDFL